VLSPSSSPPLPKRKPDRKDLRSLFLCIQNLHSMFSRANTLVARYPPSSSLFWKHSVTRLFLYYALQSDLTTTIDGKLGPSRRLSRISSACTIGSEMDLEGCKKNIGSFFFWSSSVLGMGNCFCLPCFCLMCFLSSHEFMWLGLVRVVFTSQMILFVIL
jgi:hypothetical protein